ncbi:hypothetical protein [Bacillus sp. T33-2]|uniref:hypothetical protein n=1 Tax=Bacillus sp. T33-2 TaxID=2054168 RepID=UPI000C771582|nr:hypothetical protein [Bacillus sp. T33-2]PLR99553.1 hypothetical protein CVD19_00385 [Bacillus sp. T33-2]
MKKSSMFISDNLRLDALVKGLHLDISEADHYRLVSGLYQHIEHTRVMAFKNGYDQGRFDEKMDRY